MTEKGVGSIMVTSNDLAYGIVTERDIVRKVGAKGKSLQEVKLRDLASKPIIFAEPQNTVEEAIELMTKHKIRRLPIVQEGKPVGIVTVTDLAAFLSPTRRPGFSQSVLKAISRSKF